MQRKTVIVVGAGAAGTIAAARAAELGADVKLFEKMEKPCNKILLSGNTRCNLTNSRDLDDFILMYGDNGHFLYSAFHHFFRDDLLNLLSTYGVFTEKESDGRIFPVSGKAADVVRSITGYASASGAVIRLKSKVLGIEQRNGLIRSVLTSTQAWDADAVILATGGASYSKTGATGDGYRMARELGHTITRLRPALVPLEVQEKQYALNLQGISFHNVRVTSFACNSDRIEQRYVPKIDVGRGIPGKKPRFPVIESRTGDLIFTHYGVSGPVILLMSAAIAKALEQSPVSLAIDLIPDKTERQLDIDLQQKAVKHGARHLGSILKDILPARVADLLLKINGIANDRLASQITAAERRLLVKGIKDFRLNIKCTLPLDKAMVTAGGVSLDEVNPHTMESKIVKGLYFCGEILDLDADTGGFNLQAAFSTGYLAGESASQSK